MPTPKRYTVTAALPYANGPLHIGHLAGCYLPADIYVRYLRLRGKDVKFICGSDEHGVAIIMKARAEGVPPQEIVDKYHRLMQESFAGFGISFDVYGRTTDPEHHKMAAAFFLRLHEKGSFEEKTTEQYYDPEAKQFLADRYIEGTCPKCGHDGAYGDQCENCGSSLNPTDLKNPRSRLSGATPERRQTRHWFLPLNHLSERIREYIQSHSGWKPNVYGQCMSWLQEAGGLQARSMTRDLDWGIKVPLKDAEGKVLYVWFDAPIGYISATRKLLGADWEKYWKDPETSLIHFIGKDNIVFHCIIFPAMLMEHGDYILPDQVPANEFLNLEGRKISTSRNWAVWLHEYLKDFPGQQDSLRYALCAAAPETKDNDFTWKDFQTRNNSELVAIFGNFVNRVLVLTHKYYEGEIPESGAMEPEDEMLLTEVATAPQKIGQALERYKFREALSSYMALARAGNKYLTDQEPWKTIKTDAGRTASVMYTAVQVCAQLAQLGEVFMPFTAHRLRSYLHMSDPAWPGEELRELLPAGHRVERGELLFQKIEDNSIEEQRQKLEATARQNQPVASDITPLKDEVSFEMFEKMDLRVGKVVEAVRVPKTDKLLRLKVDIGLEQRDIVSGIAGYFEPGELPGRQVVVLANLAPRKIRGIESQGMILMAENQAGELMLVTPQSEIESGAIIR